jgi:ketosteroid isomerase-like protein
MSEENVDALRSLYQEFARGDFGSADDLGDDFEVATAPQMPDAGTYRGEAARSWLNAWVKSFQSLTMDPVAFIDAGSLVVVEFIQKGTPRGGNTAVELRTWAVYTVQDDRSISRMELFMTRGEALEAAGLSE